MAARDGGWFDTGPKVWPADIDGPCCGVPPEPDHLGPCGDEPAEDVGDDH
jgi:hypothetical protein